MKKLIRMMWIVMTTYTVAGMITPLMFIETVNLIYSRRSHVELNGAGVAYLLLYAAVTTAYMWSDVKALFRWVRSKISKKETA